MPRTLVLALKVPCSIQTRLVGHPQISLYCLQQMGAEGSRPDARQVEGLGWGVRCTLGAQKICITRGGPNLLSPLITPYERMFIEGEGVT